MHDLLSHVVVLQCDVVHSYLPTYYTVVYHVCILIESANHNQVSLEED